MAQGSRFVAPRFNGPGLWDPRIPGQAYPEPKEGVPYVEGTDGLGGCGCGASGVGSLLSPKVNLVGRPDFSKFRPPVHGAAQFAQMYNRNPNIAKMMTHSSTTAGAPWSTKKKVGVGLGVFGVLMVAWAVLGD